MEKLGINPIQLAAQIINIGIIFFVLKKFLYKPILNLLEKRKETIEKGVKLSSQMEEKMASLETKEKDLERKIKAKANQEISEERKKALKQAEEIISKAQEEAKKIKKQAKQQITDQLAGEKSQLEAKVIQKALVLANQALEELLPKDIKFKLLESQIKKVASQKG